MPSNICRYLHTARVLRYLMFTFFRMMAHFLDDIETGDPEFFDSKDKGSYRHGNKQLTEIFSFREWHQMMNHLPCMETFPPDSAEDCDTTARERRRKPLESILIENADDYYPTK